MSIACPTSGSSTAANIGGFESKRGHKLVKPGYPLQDCRRRHLCHVQYERMDVCSRCGCEKSAVYLSARF